jgi:small subunit ribosomal protein S15
MKDNKTYPPLPEDLIDLMKRATLVRKHLESHKRDKHSRRGLDLIESKIKRLIKYYKRKKLIAKDWKYDPEKAKIIVR